MQHFANIDLTEVNAEFLSFDDDIQTYIIPNSALDQDQQVHSVKKRGRRSNK
jgi:hypothetical protein